MIDGGVFEPLSASNLGMHKEMDCDDDAAAAAAFTFGFKAVTVLWTLLAFLSLPLSLMFLTV